MAYRAPEAAVEAAAAAAPHVSAEDVIAVLDAGAPLAIADVLRHMAGEYGFFTARDKIMRRADAYANGGIG